MIADRQISTRRQSQNATSADADVPPDNPEQADRATSDIVVTGTRIVRPNLKSNAPITTIDQSYLRERGLARIEDALSQLPQITPMLGLQGNGVTQRTEVNLRKLGAGRTLTLLNGQRVDNDVSIIPGALVERIDILTGGASAVYGSDAIAGVVNYVLKRRFNGIVLDAETNAFQHRNDNRAILDAAKEAGYALPPRNYFGRSDEYASLAAGTDLFDKRLNISGFVEWSHIEPIRASSIDTVACPLLMNPPGVKPVRNDHWSCNLQDYSRYGQFTLGNYATDFALARDGSRAWRTYDPNDMIRTPNHDYLQRADTTVTAGAFATADLPGSLRLDASFLRTHFRQGSQKDQSNYPYFAEGASITCDNPFLGRQQAEMLCGEAAGQPVLSDPVSLQFWRPAMPESLVPTLTDWRGSAQLSGPVTDKIRFEVGYQRSRNSFSNQLTNVNDYTSGERLPRGLQVRNVNGVPTCLSKIDGTDPTCLPVDVFSSTATLAPEVWHWLTANGVFHDKRDSEIISGVLSGTLEEYGLKSPWAQSGIGFALIGEQRRIHIDSGGTEGLEGVHDYAAGARVREIGGELDAPLIEDKPFVRSLSVNGGYRLSRYTTYDRLVPTWKIEGSYAPVEGVRVRGSVNRAVRVAMLERLEAETYQGNTMALDLCAPPRDGSTKTRYTYEQCQFGGVTREQYEALTDYHGCDRNGACPGRLIYGGNPNLQPERGRSYTLGLVLQPTGVPGLTGSVDLYDIHVEKGFESARWEMAFDGCYTQRVSFWCSFYRRDPKTGVLKDIDARWTNGGDVHSRGVDLALNYALDPKKIGVHGEIGSFAVSLNGSLATRQDYQIAPGTPMRACSGYFGFLCGSPTPKWRHVVGLHWRMPQDRGGIGLTWRYTDAVRLTTVSRPVDVPFPLISRIPAYSYFDASANVRVTRFLDLRVNVQNLFDKDPPLLETGAVWNGFWNTFPAYYTVTGRVIRAGLTAHL
ncbi:conserved hypothetical protein [Sphingomonas sp. 8AM]|nr:conserved hypothetical protein [Sphingomonas sp. 8AM]